MWQFYVATLLFAGRCAIRCCRQTGTFLQILLIGLEILNGRCRCGRCGCVLIRIWIENFRHQHADPSRRRQTATIQIVTPSLQTPSHLNGLRKITFVWYLDYVSPGALIVFRKHRCSVFDFSGTWCGRTIISAYNYICDYVLRKE